MRAFSLGTSCGPDGCPTLPVVLHAESVAVAPSPVTIHKTRTIEIGNVVFPR